MQDPAGANSVGRSPEENIPIILTYISEHYKTVTLGELAQFFNYSERQIARILKEYTDKTFIALVKSAKLAKACELLRDTDLTIQSIVKLIGYSNVSYFYSIFRKEYTYTPAEYRKNIRQ